MFFECVRECVCVCGFANEMIERNSPRLEGEPLSRLL